MMVILQKRAVQMQENDCLPAEFSIFSARACLVPTTGLAIRMRIDKEICVPAAVATAQLEFGCPPGFIRQKPLNARLKRQLLQWTRSLMWPVSPVKLKKAHAGDMVISQCRRKDYLIHLIASAQGGVATSVRLIQVKGKQKALAAQNEKTRRRSQ